MAGIEWLKELEVRHHCYGGADDPHSRDVEQLIAAVRFAERRFRKLRDMDISAGALHSRAREYLGRLRSGDVEEKPCKPS